MASSGLCHEARTTCWGEEIGLADIICYLYSPEDCFQEGQTWSSSICPTLREQRAKAGYIKGTTQTGDRRLNRGKGLKGHLSPISLGRLGN